MSNVYEISSISVALSRIPHVLFNRIDRILATFRCKPRQIYNKIFIYLFIIYVLNIYIVLRSNIDLIPWLPCIRYIYIANIRYEASLLLRNSDKKGRCETRVACRSRTVTITGSTTPGIGFLVTIFGRQAVGKVLARESDIEENT